MPATCSPRGWSSPMSSADSSVQRYHCAPCPAAVKPGLQTRNLPSGSWVMSWSQITSLGISFIRGLCSKGSQQVPPPNPFLGFLELSETSTLFSRSQRALLVLWAPFLYPSTPEVPSPDIGSHNIGFLSTLPARFIWTPAHEIHISC